MNRWHGFGAGATAAMPAIGWWDRLIVEAMERGWAWRLAIESPGQMGGASADFADIERSPGQRANPAAAGAPCQRSDTNAERRSNPSSTSPCATSGPPCAHWRAKPGNFAPNAADRPLVVPDTAKVKAGCKRTKVKTRGDDETVAQTSTPVVLSRPLLHPSKYSGAAGLPGRMSEAGVLVGCSRVPMRRAAHGDRGGAGQSGDRKVPAAPAALAGFRRHHGDPRAARAVGPAGRRGERPVGRFR